MVSGLESLTPPRQTQTPEQEGEEMTAQEAVVAFATVVLLGIALAVHYDRPAPLPAFVKPSCTVGTPILAPRTAHDI